MFQWKRPSSWTSLVSHKICNIWYITSLLCLRLPLQLFYFSCLLSRIMSLFTYFVLPPSVWWRTGLDCQVNEVELFTGIALRHNMIMCVSSMITWGNWRACYCRECSNLSDFSNLNFIHWVLGDYFLLITTDQQRNCKRSPRCQNSLLH